MCQPPWSDQHCSRCWRRCACGWRLIAIDCVDAKRETTPRLSLVFTWKPGLRVVASTLWCSCRPGFLNTEVQIQGTTADCNRAIIYNTGSALRGMCQPKPSQVPEDHCRIGASSSKLAASLSILAMLAAHERSPGVNERWLVALETSRKIPHNQLASDTPRSPRKVTTVKRRSLSS